MDGGRFFSNLDHVETSERLRLELITVTAQMINGIPFSFPFFPLSLFLPTRGGD